MKDGLYRVCERGICAGFFVEKGRVVRCAPILRKRIDYWIRCSTWISA
jgi:putative component of membrane protein insertase Oxa1/YidC/SpoIIIJ protein YidD